MNYENFCTVLAKIEANPDESNWDQTYWWPSCGTGCCIAGHSVIAGGMSSQRPGHDWNGSWTKHTAANFLGIHPCFAHWLFSPNRTLDDFRRIRLVAGYTRFSALG